MELCSDRYVVEFVIAEQSIVRVLYGQTLFCPRPKPPSSRRARGRRLRPIPVFSRKLKRAPQPDDDGGNAVNRLKGKHCLVTAAAQGIGREIARQFAAQGATVLATDISEGVVQELAEEHERLAIAALDVTDPRQIRAVCSGVAFDAVVNVAGYVHQGSILDCDDEDWRRTFLLNVDSMFRVCKAVLPAMLERGRGSIINMSSVASSIKGVPNRFAYSTSKAAVIGLSKSIAADFVASGVRCNAICPGTVETPSLAERVRALGGDEAEVWKSFRERQPMGRLGRPEEIASLAVYLASDESAFTTGTIQVIDGGWSN
jgi:2-keto-3-deoxy-L-fuconate dehydrogenase